MVERFVRLCLVTIFFLLLCSISLAKSDLEKVRGEYAETIDCIAKDSVEIDLYIKIFDEEKVSFWVVAKKEDQGYEKSDFKSKIYICGGEMKRIDIVNNIEDTINSTVENYFSDGKLYFSFESTIIDGGYDYDKDIVLNEGPYAVERRSYFNESGEEFKETVKSYSKVTGKNVAIEYLKYNKDDFPVYKQIAELPFIW